MSSLSLMPVTMTSLELVEFINASRDSGDTELRHDNFMAKVPKVIGETNAPKFLGAQTYGNGNTRAIYIFPKREACLMAMSYSYDLQAKVFDRMCELEAKQTSKHEIPNDVSIALFHRGLAIAAMLKVPEHLAQSEVVKEVRLACGVDFSPYLKLAPAQQGMLTHEEMLEPTELGRIIGLSAANMNQRLESAGMQTKTVDGWALTELGAPYATRHHWQSKGGIKSGYNMKWRRAVLKMLDL